MNGFSYILIQAQMYRLVNLWIFLFCLFSGTKLRKLCGGEVLKKTFSVLNIRRPEILISWIYSPYWQHCIHLQLMDQKRIAIKLYSLENKIILAVWKLNCFFFLFFFFSKKKLFFLIRFCLYWICCIKNKWTSGEFNCWYVAPQLLKQKTKKLLWQKVKRL